jgi:hypothetical protein
MKRPIWRKFLIGTIIVAVIIIVLYQIGKIIEHYLGHTNMGGYMVFFAGAVLGAIVALITRYYVKGRGDEMEKFELEEKNERLEEELDEASQSINELEKEIYGESSTPQCVKCGSTRVIPIRYGYPGDKMLKLSKEGKIKLGGCVVVDDNPNLCCVKCENEWLDKKYPYPSKQTNKRE